MNLRLKIGLIVSALALFLVTTYVVPQYNIKNASGGIAAAVDDSSGQVPDETAASDTTIDSTYSDETPSVDTPATPTATSDSSTNTNVQTIAPSTQPVTSINTSVSSQTTTTVAPSQSSSGSAQPTGSSSVKPLPASSATFLVLVIDENKQKISGAHIVVRGIDGALLGEGDTTVSGSAVIHMVYKDIAKIATVEAVQGRKRTMIPYTHAAVSINASVTGPAITLHPNDILLKDESLGNTQEQVLVPYGITTTKTPFVSSTASCPLGVAALATSHSLWAVGSVKKPSMLSVQTMISVPTTTQAVALSAAIADRIDEITVNDVSVWKNSAAVAQSYTHGCAKLQDVVVSVPAAAFKKDGTDSVVFTIENFGGESYFDYSITALTPAPLPPSDINDSFFDYIKKQISGFFNKILGK